MKFLIILFFFLSFQSQAFGQSIKIDNIDVSIGDSLEQVINKFPANNYHLMLDTTKQSIHCSIFKKNNYYNKDSTITVKIIGYLYFSYLNEEIAPNYKKDLYQIEKVWSDYYSSNNIADLLNIINNIIEKNSIDNYSAGLFYSKNIEPEYTSKKISINLNAFTSLELYFRDDNYFEVSEVITKDETRFKDEEYILIFEDYKHYYGDKEYIIEYFKKEDAANRRKRELLIKYILDYSELPETKIVRFYKEYSFKK